MAGTYEVRASDLDDFVAEARSWRSRAEASEAEAVHLRTQVQSLMDDGKRLREKLRLSDDAQSSLKRRVEDAEAMRWLLE